MKGNTRHRMAEAHEEFLADLFGGRKSKGSGSKFNDQMDGRNNRYEQAFAYAWDGKSTLGKSISITREMVEKAREQASTEKPALALRFYNDERLTSFDDWIVVSAEDFRELLEAARDA